MEEEEWQPEEKKQKKDNCIIHCSENGGKIVDVKCKLQWEEICNVAKTVGQEFLLDIESQSLVNGVPTNVHYHKNCRSVLMQRYKRSKKSSSRPEDSASDNSNSKLSRNVNSKVLLPKTCMFCGLLYINKKKKSRGEKELAHKIAGEHAREAIKNAQVVKKKEHVQHLLNNYDLVAAEAHFHYGCYNNFTKITSTGASSTEDTTAEDKFIEYVRHVVSRKQVVSMEELYQEFCSILSIDYSVSQKSTKKKVKRILKNNFSEDLHIHQMKNLRLLIVPKKLSLLELAEDYFKLKSNEDHEQCLTTAGKYLRQEAKEHKPIFTWPPQPLELSSNVEIPEKMKIFLRSLLNLSKSAEFNLKCLSLFNDISFAVTKVPSSKHILIASSIKSLTGNVELIKFLNRFGHAISQSKLSEIETAQAIMKITSTQTEGVVLPEEVQIGQPTTLVYDNIDRLEETLSGSGTSHRVNGITIQKGFIGPLPLKKYISIPKTKQRSIECEESLIAPYHSGKRPCPPFLKRNVERFVTHNPNLLALKKNFLWILTRHHQRYSQGIPSWTGFNILLRKDCMVFKDNIGYLPTINSPATSFSTIHEMLCQAKVIQDQLGLEYIVIVCDQAIYAKAIEVLWAHTSKFNAIVLRLGGFHTICTLLAVIGKRFGNAGLRDIAIESGVIAEGSVNAVLDGKQYNRSVRFHKLMYEAFMRIIWEQFTSWVTNNHANGSGFLDELSSKVKDTSAEYIDTLLQNHSFGKIFELFEKYTAILKSGTGPMSEFWMSYMEMVSTLLNLIRASREGDFDLHLNSVESMIPWCFAYDRTNYSRYLPWYAQSMRDLENSNPSAWTYLQNGGFSTQMSSSNTFGRIPMDQVIEETANKDTQTPGGTKGFSLNKGAVSRYYITADYRKACLRNLREMVNEGNRSASHPDLRKGRIRRDENDVQLITNLFSNVWRNPFEDGKLCNISTGICASNEVEEDLLLAHQKGLSAYSDFLVQRLSASRVKSFFDTIPKLKLKTFGSMNTKRVHAKGKDVELKIDRDLFGKMAIIAQNRQLDMKEVMKFELGPFPWSLATCDGMLRKTNKASLANNLEKLSLPPDENLQKPAVMIDAMSLVQKTIANNKTFSQVANSIFSRIMNDGFGCKRIDVVFDVYRELSIKNVERSKRGNSDAPMFSQILPDHNIKQWARFLKGSHNKSELIKFFVREWGKEAYTNRLRDTVLMIGFGTECVKLSSNGIEEIPELSCFPEEADTMMLLMSLKKVIKA